MADIDGVFEEVGAVDTGKLSPSFGWLRAGLRDVAWPADNGPFVTCARPPLEPESAWCDARRRLIGESSSCAHQLTLDR